uniref:hypothetical protein n=1 Tax=Paraburkholderia strydomiana TaxID=1245417 RepID=UPI0038BDC4D5
MAGIGTDVHAPGIACRAGAESADARNLDRDGARCTDDLRQVELRGTRRVLQEVRVFDLGFHDVFEQLAHRLASAQTADRQHRLPGFDALPAAVIDADDFWKRGTAEREGARLRRPPGHACLASAGRGIVGSGSSAHCVRASPVVSGVLGWISHDIVSPLQKLCFICRRLSRHFGILLNVSTTPPFPVLARLCMFESTTAFTA